MKKFTDRLFTGLFALACALTLALGIAAILPEAVAQIRNVNPTPAIFQDYTGTNWIGFNASANVEVRSAGTIYTGSTTNVSLTNNYALRIVNGVVTGLVPNQ